jgi:hypothetical protein
LKNLTYPEKVKLQASATKLGLSVQDDPLEEYQRLLLQYVEYVWMCRRKTSTLKQCLALGQAGFDLKKEILQTFPHKSGILHEQLIYDCL